MKTAKIELDGKVLEVKIAAEYPNGECRIEYPVYYNGLYAGTESQTIDQAMLIVKRPNLFVLEPMPGDLEKVTVHLTVEDIEECREVIQEFIEDLVEQSGEQIDTIVRLAEHPECKEFKDAVCEHRRIDEILNRYMDLKKRLTAAVLALADAREIHPGGVIK